MIWGILEWWWQAVGWILLLGIVFGEGFRDLWISLSKAELAGGFHCHLRKLDMEETLRFL